MLKQLREERLSARKNKLESAKMLTVLLSDAEALAKVEKVEVNDAHVSKASSQWLKKLEALCESFPTAENLADLEITRKYAPKVLTADESLDLVRAYVECNGYEKNQMGKVIAELSASNPGLNKKAVSEFLKAL